MKQPDGLFTLIKGLSKTEKRYFKRYTLISGHAGSNYINLFNAIEKQKIYSEAEIKKQFKGQVFVKQFSVTKNYLFHLVLKSMELYHQNNSPDGQIRSLLNRAGFLFDRSMYRECVKVLNKAREKTEKYELYNFSLEIVRMVKKIKAKGGEVEAREAINREESDILSRMQNTQEILALRDRIFLQLIKTGIGEKQKEPMGAFLRHALLKDEKNAKTFLAKYYFWDARVVCNVGLARKEEIYKGSKKIIELYATHPSLSEYHITNYLAILYNFHFTCDAIGNLDEVKYGVDHFIRARQYVKNENDRVSFYYHKSIVLHYYNTMGDFDKAIQYSKDNILSEWEAYKDKGDPVWNFELVTYIATGYFGKGDLHTALKWLNKIYQEIKMEYYADLVLFGYMFYFIVHYELKNFDLLPSLLQSMKRYSQKNERTNEFHAILFRFFQKISDQDPKAGSLKEIAGAAKKEIDGLNKNVIEFEFRKWFDYMSWLESKIENRSFAEVVRKKAGT